MSDHEDEDLANLLTVGMCRLSPLGECLFVNEAWCEMAGISAAEALHSGWQRAVHPDDLEHVNIRRQHTSHPVTSRFEFRFRHPDGRVVWVLAETKAQRNAAGEVVGRIACVTDISDRKRIEQWLATRNEILAEILAGAPLAGVLEMVVRAVEARAPDLVCSVLLLHGDRLAHGAAPSLPAEYNRAIDGARIGPSAASCGTAAYRREPVFVEDIATDPLWAEYRELVAPHGLRACWSVPILGSERDVLGTFAMYHREPRRPTPEEQALVTDATRFAGLAIERVRAAEALHERAQALRDSRELLEAIIEGTTSLVFVKDVQGRYLLANREFMRAGGVRVEDVLGKTDAELFLPHEAVAFRATDLAVIEARRTLKNMAEVATTVEGVHSFLTVKSPLFDRNGEVYAVCCIATDITERQQLEARVQQHQKMEAMGRLASSIAHDFNNLLMAISANADLAGRAVTTDAARNSLGDIRKAVGLAGSLTRQLLTFSRQQVREIRTLNVNEVVMGVQSILRGLAAKTIRFTTNLSSRSLSIAADQSQVEQVLLNLVINACDAMPDGGELTLTTAHVDLDEVTAMRLGVPKAGEFASIEVRDTGIGMSEKTRARLFEPFFTTKALGKGTGLGLATVYGICQQSGGHVLVESEQGNGACFTVLLPYKEGTQEGHRVRAAIPASAGLGLVLLVDDEELVTTAVEKVLQHAGYGVLTAPNGEVALRLVETTREPIDLLLSDVVMPGMNGLELARRVRALRPAIRLLFMSGNTAGVLSHAGELPAGAELIAKTESVDDLLAAVRRTLAVEAASAS